MSFAPETWGGSRRGGAAPPLVLALELPPVLPALPPLELPLVFPVACFRRLPLLLPLPGLVVFAPPTFVVLTFTITVAWSVSVTFVPLGEVPVTVATFVKLPETAGREHA